MSRPFLPTDLNENDFRTNGSEFSVRTFRGQPTEINSPLQPGMRRERKPAGPSVKSLVTELPLQPSQIITLEHPFAIAIGTYTLPTTTSTMSSIRPSIQRPSQEDSVNFPLSPTAVTQSLPGSATSSPALDLLEDDFYGSSRISERQITSYGPYVTVGGTASSPSRQVPSDLLMPDF